MAIRFAPKAPTDQETSEWRRAVDGHKAEKVHAALLAVSALKLGRPVKDTSERSLKPWLALGMSRRTWYRRKKTVAT